MITAIPEFRIAVFGFLTAFAWEMWQLPFYDTSGMAMFDMVKGCSLASFGDAGIMVFAYWIAAQITKSNNWISDLNQKSLLIYLAVGVAITTAVEHIALNVAFGWRYSDLMPLDPVLGTGLVPLLMWIIVPLVTLWLARLPAPR